jgi:hypothetical protein
VNAKGIIWMKEWSITEDEEHYVMWSFIIGTNTVRAIKRRKFRWWDMQLVCER